MLPALKKVVLAKDRPIPSRSSGLFGNTYAHGTRLPAASGGASSRSCHLGSRWRSYQRAYSSTIACVAGWVVTSSTHPSPMTQTRRPSRNASRYSPPVLIRCTLSSFRRVDSVAQRAQARHEPASAERVIASCSRQPRADETHRRARCFRCYLQEINSGGPLVGVAEILV